MSKQQKADRASAEARQIKWSIGQTVKAEPEKLIQDSCAAFGLWLRERELGPMGRVTLRG